MLFDHLPFMLGHTPCPAIRKMSWKGYYILKIEKDMIETTSISKYKLHV